MINFTYRDLVAAHITMEVNSGAIEDVNPVGREAEIFATCLHEANVMFFNKTLVHETVMQAVDFLERDSDAFMPKSHIEQFISNILSDPGWFPEDIELLKERVAYATSALSITVDEGTELIAAHEQLFDIWRHHQYHHNIQKAISTMAIAYGSLNNRHIGDSEWGCLYHRGMDVSADPALQRIVDTYNEAKEILGFTPALLPPECHTAINDNLVCTGTEEGGLVVKIPTFVGMIWLEGAPVKKSMGTSKLSLV